MSKADWTSTAVTLIGAAIAFCVGGPAAAIICGSAGILIIIGIHFLASKSKEEKFLYFMGCLVFMPVLYFSVTGHSVIYEPPVTPENINDHLTMWLKKAGYPCSDGSSSDYSFSLQCPVNDHIVVVGVLKSKSSWLLVTTQTYLPPDKALSLQKMPRDAFVKLAQNIRIQTTQFGLEYWSKATVQGPWATLKYIHIDEGMKPRDVLETIQHLYSATVAVEQTVDRQLNITSDIGLSQH